MAFHPKIANKDTGHCFKNDVNQDNAILRQRELKKSSKPPKKTTNTFNYFNRGFQ